MTVNKQQKCSGVIVQAIFVFGALLSLVACGGGGDASQPTDSPPAVPSLPAPEPSPTPAPEPEPMPPSSLGCDLGHICESFDDAQLDEAWKMSIGRGEKFSTSERSSAGTRSFQFISNNSVSVDLAETRFNTVLQMSFDNETLSDVSTNNHNIERHGGEFAEGIVGSGWQFDGNDDYLEVSHSSRLEIRRAITASLWYKHKDQAGNLFYSLIEQSANEFSGHSRYGIWIDQVNRVSACIEPDTCDGGDTCQRCVIAPSVRLIEDDWYHLAMTYDGRALKLFVNGLVAGEFTYERETNISTKPYPLTLGTDIYDGSSSFLRGIIDEVYLAERVTSDANIVTEYQALGIRDASISLPLANYPEIQQDLWGRMWVYFKSSDEDNSGSGTVAGFNFLEMSGKPKASADISEETKVSYQLGVGSNESGDSHLLAKYNTELDRNFDGISDVVTDCALPSDAISPPENQWTCIEWRFNTENNHIEYWLDGTQIISVDQRAGSCAGDDQLQVWNGPEKFTELKIGVMQTSQDLTHTMYVDELIVDTEQIGCN